MVKTGPPGVEKPQSLGEEIANSVSHGLGLAAAVGVSPWLIASAVRHGTVSTVIGASVFAASVILLYLTSTLYHSLAEDRAKRLFRVLDHCAIFILIAGTYTPFTLGVLRGAWGWTLFGLTWGLAILGIVLKAICGTKHPRLSIALYLGMGWSAILAVGPLWRLLPVQGFLLIAAGGLAYTFGLLFYSAHHRRYSHFMWHLFVIAGTSSHFLAVLWYAG